MRATYQLNAEKLEYNYRVLLERDAGAMLETVCWNAVWLAYLVYMRSFQPRKTLHVGDHATYKLWTLAHPCCALVYSCAMLYWDALRSIMLCSTNTRGMLEACHGFATTVGTSACHRVGSVQTLCNYNQAVCVHVHAENTATINQQKRKLSRQHDVLLNLKGKYSRSDSKHCEENSKLTEEYKRITEHFKDMQVC
jgi:hypothetical protein